MTTVFFIICNLFQVLIIFSFVDKMLTRKYSKKVTIIAWIIGFIVDESLVYFANNMNINTLLYYTVVILILYFFYNEHIKNKIIVLAFMCVFSMLSECIVYFVMIAFFEITEKTYLMGSASAKIIECIIIRVVLIIKKDKYIVNFNFRLWLSVLVIPMISYAFFIVQLNLNDGFSSTLVEVIFYTMFLIINYVAFSMFDDVSQVMLLKSENKILEKQKEYYIKQNEQVFALWESMREFRHNISNQYFSEQTLLREGRYEELDKRYTDMMSYVRSNVYSVRTGIFCIDSLLSYKLSMLKEMNVDIVSEFKLPTDLEIDMNDLTVIVGNLVDNATDALKEVKSDKKKFKILMFYEMPNLVIKVYNSYEGERKRDSDNNFITTKDNTDMHGIGLKSIKRIVEGYKGIVKFDVKEELFGVIIHMQL